MSARHYVAELDWQPPELIGMAPAGARVDTATERFTTRHFDTLDRALGRNGISVTIEADTCRVRLPDGAFKSTAPSPRIVPKDVQALLLGVRGGQRLVPIATAERLRKMTKIVDPSGTVRATLVDDEVIATAEDGVEVVHSRRDIVLDTPDATLRKPLRRMVRHAGARRRDADELADELVVALTAEGSEAHGGPRTATVSRLLTDYLDVQREAVLRGDVALRRGQNAIHPTRVAVRRYRSALRVFADLVDAERAAALDTELRWFSLLLGGVRDPQVRRGRLESAVAELDAPLQTDAVQTALDDSLRAEEDKARAQLDRAMRGRRYLALLAELAAWHVAPPLTESGANRDKAAARYVRRAEQQLRKRLRAVADGDDDALHRARKAAKRARYSAEAALPALGKRAAISAARAKHAQERLGDYLDATLSCAALRQLGARSSNSEGFAIGVLYQIERDNADAAYERLLRLR
jgi:CHAD domain-containing protein